MDHPGQVGLVVAHAQGAGGHHRPDPVVAEVGLGPLALGRLRRAGVGPRVDPPGGQPGRRTLGGGHRQAIDDARALGGPHEAFEPGQALGRRGEADHREGQALPVERAPQGERLGAELLGHVGHHGVGGRGRGGQHRRVGSQAVEGVAHAAVVGAEVVAPGADAVGLVDHEAAHPGGEARQHVAAERRVVEPLGADAKQVQGVGRQVGLHHRPLLHVGRVDGGCGHPHAPGGGDLVAHEGQEGAHEQGRPRAGLPQQLGGHEVDRALAPARALHHQHPAPVHHERPDGLGLVGPQARARAGQRAQQLAGARFGGGGVDGGEHGAIVRKACDGHGDRRRRWPSGPTVKLSSRFRPTALPAVGEHGEPRARPVRRGSPTRCPPTSTRDRGLGWSVLSAPRSAPGPEVARRSPPPRRPRLVAGPGASRPPVPRRRRRRPRAAPPPGTRQPPPAARRPSPGHRSLATAPLAPEPEVA